MDTHPFGWLSIVPPVLAIGLAVSSRQAVPSLLAGVWEGWVIAAGGDLFGGTVSAIQSLIDVFDDPAQTRVVIFTLLMGALLLLLERGGGVPGFLPGRAAGAGPEHDAAPRCWRPVWGSGCSSSRRLPAS